MWISVRRVLWGEMVRGKRTIDCEYDALIDISRFEIVEDCGETCRLFRAWDSGEKGLTVKHTLAEIEQKIRDLD